MNQKSAIPALTSIRGIAAWWVVLYHFRDAFPPSIPNWLVTFIAQGYLAVDLFFVLSGFVLALNYACQFRENLAASGQFYWLRFARIYPLHIFILVFFLLNPLAIHFLSARGDVSGYSWDYYLMSLLLIQNWGFTADTAWNVPAWSISAEVFAYLLFPLIAMQVGRFVLSPRASLAAMATVLVLLAAAAAASGPSLGSDIAGFGLLRCCLQFVLGMLVWRLRHLLGAPATALSGAAILAAALATTAYAILPIPDFTIMPAAFCLLVFGLADRQTHLARLLAPRWLEALGLVSYSTYLSHFFIRSWVKFLLVRPEVPDWLPICAYLLLVAVASFVLYRWVELPSRHWLRDLSARRATARKPDP